MALGTPISLLKQAPALQDNFRIELFNPNAPNSVDQSVGESLGNLRTFLITGITKLEGFEWIGNPPTVTTDGNTITVGAASAFFNDDVYEYAETVFTIVLPEEGLQRISIVSVLPETGYVLTEGDDAQSPTQAPTPTGSQYISLLLINPEGAAEVPPEQFVRYINGKLIDFNGNEIELIKKAPITLTDAATVTFNGSLSENAVLYAPTAITSLGFEQTKLGYDYSIRITEAGSKVLNLVPISGVQFKTLAGEVITELELPDSDCEIIYKHVSASERTVLVVTDRPGASVTTLRDVTTLQAQKALPGELFMVEKFADGLEGQSAFYRITTDTASQAQNTLRKAFDQPVNGYRAELLIQNNTLPVAFLNGMDWTGATNNFAELINMVNYVNARNNAGVTAGSVTDNDSNVISKLVFPRNRKINAGNNEYYFNPWVEVDFAGCEYTTASRLANVKEKNRVLPAFSFGGVKWRDKIDKDYNLDAPVNFPYSVNVKILEKSADDNYKVFQASNRGVLVFRLLKGIVTTSDSLGGAADALRLDQVYILPNFVSYKSVATGTITGTSADFSVDFAALFGYTGAFGTGYTVPFKNLNALNSKISFTTTEKQSNVMIYTSGGSTTDFRIRMNGVQIYQGSAQAANTALLIPVSGWKGTNTIEIENRTASALYVGGINFSVSLYSPSNLIGDIDTCRYENGGAQKHYFDSSSANDYAIHKTWFQDKKYPNDATKRFSRWAGSFHGGETLVSRKIILDNTPQALDANYHVVNGFLKSFREMVIEQTTTIAFPDCQTLGASFSAPGVNLTLKSTIRYAHGKAHEFSASFISDAPDECWFDQLFTQMTGTSNDLKRLAFPYHIESTTNGLSDRPYFYLGKCGKVIQEDPADGRRLVSMFNTYDNDDTYGGTYIIDNRYQKLYYGPVYAGLRKIESLSWWQTKIFE